MREIKHSILNKEGEKLIGIEILPSIEAERYPTVILAHGFGDTKHESGMFDDIANVLSKSGILVYRFDFSGCGESDGDYSETSLSKLSSDLSMILEFVRSQDKVDVSRIGILGQSFGTSTTIALEPDVNCIILMGTLYHLKEIFMRFFGEDFNAEGLSIKARSDGSDTIIKPGFWKDFENHDIAKSLKNITCPILFIHGEKDGIVPLSEMEACYEAANEPKEKVILEGADHGLRPAREQMYKFVEEWFRKHLVS